MDTDFNLYRFADYNMSSIINMNVIYVYTLYRYVFVGYAHNALFV